MPLPLIPFLAALFAKGGAAVAAKGAGAALSKGAAMSAAKAAATAPLSQGATAAAGASMAKSAAIEGLAPYTQALLQGASTAGQGSPGGTPIAGSGNVVAGHSPESFLAMIQKLQAAGGMQGLPQGLPGMFGSGLGPRRY